MRSTANVLAAGPGGLTQPAGAAGCIARAGGTEGCAAGRALRGPVDLAISRDGRHIYTASSLSDGVAILRRDPERVLSANGSAAGAASARTAAGDGQSGRGLDEVWGIALSPDGRNGYAVSPRVNMLSAIRETRRAAAWPSSRDDMPASSAPGCSAVPRAAG